MQEREPFGGFGRMDLTCARNTASKDEAMEFSQAISSILPGPLPCVTFTRPVHSHNPIQPFLHNISQSILVARA